MIRCNNNTLQLEWTGRRGQTEKGTKKNRIIYCSFELRNCQQSFTVGTGSVLHTSILHLHAYSVYVCFNIILRTATTIQGFPTKSVYVILGELAYSWKSSYYFRHVRTYCPTSRWTYFHEIWYWLSWKSVEKNLVRVKTGKNIGHFTESQVHFVLNRRH